MRIYPDSRSEPKTHCKLALLARQDSDGEIRQYAHLGTGNYNPSTAHFYSDLSLLTCEPELTSAVHAVFNFLTARSEQSNYKPLFVSPIDLAKNCIALIDHETMHARRKRPARIIAKVNTLLDQSVIEALYRASRAGVEIDLIIRGACALRPNVSGLSHSIRVRSIVGRFLEHSRIFYFENDGQPDLYLGSADWMPRNLTSGSRSCFPLGILDCGNGCLMKSCRAISRTTIRLAYCGKMVLMHVSPTQAAPDSAETAIALAHRISSLTWRRKDILRRQSPA